MLAGCWKSSWRPPRRTCCARCPERDGTHCGAGQELLCAVEGEAGGHGGGEVEQEQEPEHLPGGEQRLHGSVLSNWGAVNAVDCGLAGVRCRRAPRRGRWLAWGSGGGRLRRGRRGRPGRGWG